mmetsp:Transcript_3511/g.7659  ORF Transcript_3511/g.7659 Transcript_3511/m.7659 type:complete len:228 (-) Transcript_3511:259-942(-)
MWPPAYEQGAHHALHLVLGALISSTDQAARPASSQQPGLSLLRLLVHLMVRLYAMLCAPLPHGQVRWGRSDEEAAGRCCCMQLCKQHVALVVAQVANQPFHEKDCWFGGIITGCCQHCWQGNLFKVSFDESPRCTCKGSLQFTGVSTKQQLLLQGLHRSRVHLPNLHTSQPWQAPCTSVKTGAKDDQLLDPLLHNCKFDMVIQLGGANSHDTGHSLLGLVSAILCQD